MRSSQNRSISLPESNFPTWFLFKKHFWYFFIHFRFDDARMKIYFVWISFFKELPSFNAVFLFLLSVSVFFVFKIHLHFNPKSNEMIKFWRAKCCCVWCLYEENIYLFNYLNYLKWMSHVTQSTLLAADPFFQMCSVL